MCISIPTLLYRRRDSVGPRFVQMCSEGWSGQRAVSGLVRHLITALFARIPLKDVRALQPCYPRTLPSPFPSLDVLLGIATIEVAIGLVASCHSDQLNTGFHMR